MKSARLWAPTERIRVLRWAFKPGMQGLPRKLSIGLLVAVFAICVYRAWTQSLAIDEAWAFKLFVNKNWATLITQYDACNHVLHTVLTKVFRQVFGISELDLRLASLAGCLIYLTAAY